MKQASVSSIDQGGGKRRLGLGTASFLLAISMFQHAIPTHIRPQVRDLALRGLAAMMIAVELTTLLWWRRADDDHQNEGCGIDHGDRDQTVRYDHQPVVLRPTLFVVADTSTQIADLGDEAHFRAGVRRPRLREHVAHFGDLAFLSSLVDILAVRLAAGVFQGPYVLASY